jgi:NAD(P)-dependent dehydrogenase (short-subunit alcohol dehydrogenase family)
VAVVTGATSGIGGACARRLAGQGVDLVLAGRSRSAMDSVVEAVERIGATAIAVIGDLTREEDARELAAAVARLGRLDYAINAAGAVAVGPLVDLGAEEFDSVIAANLKATFLSMKHEIPAIAATGGGAIVNVSSRAGLVGTPGGAAYSAAKHGVVGLTKSAALEAAPLGIRINALCPGPTGTAQFERIVGRLMPDVPTAAAAAEFGAKLPLGRIATADEIAGSAVWLLGPDAAFMTGAAVPVDGGSGAG